jgi:hypothetical protein
VQLLDHAATHVAPSPRSSTATSRSSSTHATQPRLSSQASSRPKPATTADGRADGQAASAGQPSACTHDTTLPNARHLRPTVATEVEPGVKFVGRLAEWCRCCAALRWITAWSNSRVTTTATASTYPTRTGATAESTWALPMRAQRAGDRSELADTERLLVSGELDVGGCGSGGLPRVTQAHLRG